MKYSTLYIGLYQFHGVSSDMLISTIKQKLGHHLGRSIHYLSYRYLHQSRHTILQDDLTMASYGFTQDVPIQLRYVIYSGFQPYFQPVCKDIQIEKQSAIEPIPPISLPEEVSENHVSRCQTIWGGIMIMISGSIIGCLCGGLIGCILPLLVVLKEILDPEIYYYFYIDFYESYQSNPTIYVFLLSCMGLLFGLYEGYQHITERWN